MNAKCRMCGLNMNIKDIIATAKELEEYWASFPDWYWKYGLHDAEVLSVSEKELIPDYKDRQPKYNCMEICLDCKNALYERDIEKILLYNYKIKTPDFDVKTLGKAWWMDDSLKEQKKGYYLSEIEVETADSERIDFTVSYESAEVIRK